jgi:putative transposase
MPRLSRLTIPGELHFVAQRGLAQRKVFIDDVDRRSFVDALREVAAAHDVAVHAYALLDDEVQWLATPADALSLGQVAQGVGRRFVAAANRRHGLRGTCWAGRFRSAVIDGGAFGLGAMVLVDREPVAQGLVSDPGAWPWSSAAHHVGTARAPWLRDHPALWGLGNTPFEREAAYASLLRQPADQTLRVSLHGAAARGWAFGGGGFTEWLMRQSAPPRALQPRPRGRPRLG